jgi:hypothetical protein
LADSPGHHGLANGTLKILYDFSVVVRSKLERSVRSKLE